MQDDHTLMKTYLPCKKVDQDVIKMSVSKAYDVPYHGHDGRGAAKRLGQVPPLRGTPATAPQLPV